MEAFESFVALALEDEGLVVSVGFAALCGTNPILASSGKANRHRLNRGGDRQANSALWRIVIVRLASNQKPATTSTSASRKARPRSKRSAASSGT